MKTATKPEKLGSLIKKVDEQVSLFVRLNAADQFGAISCVCCGQRVFWKDAQCAHFKDRDNMATRFYLPNLGAAAKECNQYDHYGHIVRWAAKLGEREVTHLDVMSHSLQKWTRPELEDLLYEYTAKVKILRNQKGL